MLAAAVVLSVAVYLPTLSYPPIFDDFPQIVNNPELRSWSSLPGFFTHHVWEQLHPLEGHYYRPLLKVWFFLNYSLFGLWLPGWHAASIALHALAVLLVSLLAARITQDRVAAGIAAIIFAVHPAHIENVTWLSGVNDVLLAVFFVAALLFYVRYAEAGGKWRLAGSLTAFFAALLTKEVASTFCVLVFAYVFFRRSENGVRARMRLAGALRATIPFLLLTGLYLAIRGAVIGTLVGHQSELPLSTVLLTAPSLALFYLKHLVAPFDLSLLYDTYYVTPANLALLNFGLPLAIVLAVLGLLAWWARKSPLIGFVSLLMLMPLLPSMDSRLFLYREMAHDRYLYLPSIGFALLVGLAIRRLRAEGSRWFGQPALQVAAVGALAGLLALSTVAQNRYWSSALVLYAHAVDTAPNNENALEMFGNELLQRSRPEDALLAFDRACKLAPQRWEIHFKAGGVAFQAGKLRQAEAYLRRAVELAPGVPMPQYFLGLTLLEQGRAAEAEPHLARAVELSPGVENLHATLGRAMLAQGRRDQALAQFRAELASHPDNPVAKAALAELAPAATHRISSASR